MTAHDLDDPHFGIAPFTFRPTGIKALAQELAVNREAKR